MSDQWKYDHAQWEVMWVTTKGGEKRIIATDFELDFVSALALYVKACKAGKKLVTLRCKNVGFSPPHKYQGKMAAYNKQGVWWCPYCATLRRFEKRSWAEDGDAIYNVDPEYCCPMCDISHNDHHVIKHNPIAQRLAYGKGRKGGRRKKRARR